MVLKFSRRLLGLLAAPMVAAVLTVTSSATAATAAPVGARQAARFCGHPQRGSAVQLTLADNGRRLCVRRGQMIVVTLRVDLAGAPAPEQWWSSVSATGSSLQPLPPPFVAARGVTVAHLRAADRGTAVLRSTRRPCRPTGNHGPRCHLVQNWTAVIQIQ